MKNYNGMFKQKLKQNNCLLKWLIEYTEVYNLWYVIIIFGRKSEENILKKNYDA